MLLIGGIFFTLLGIYFENVIPSEFGSHKHPCFICMPKSYTCCRKKRQVIEEFHNSEHAENLLEEAQNDDLELRTLQPGNYEPVQAEIARQELDGRYLRIDNLQKTYENGF